LERDDVADGVVFDFAQFLRVDGAVLKALSGGQEFRWAQETTDVIGSKRWRFSRFHELKRTRGSSRER
jgi:hypothetical protein